MTAKTFRAPTMKAALSQVRRDLGGQAFILGTREVRRRGLFGARRRTLVEVRASAASPIDINLPITQTAGEARTHADRPLDAHVGAELARLHAMVAALSDQGSVEHLVPELPRELAATYARLLDVNIQEPLARRLIQLVAERLRETGGATEDQAEATLAEIVDNCLSIAPPIVVVSGVQRVVAVVGPTGAGKTTTLAKLAATFKLVEGFTVGFASVGAHRVGGADQLKTYAEIIDVPFASASSQAEIGRAMQSLGDVDLVFVDTAGISPRDGVKIRELSDFLAEIRPDETHLVVSAASTEQFLRSTLERFEPLSCDRLILTKFDEAAALGHLLSVIPQSAKPISYLTMGQAVPDDIEPADSRRLTALILGRDWAGEESEPEEAN